MLFPRMSFLSSSGSKHGPEARAPLGWAAVLLLLGAQTAQTGDILRGGAASTNANRTVGDIEGALDTVAPLFKRLVASGHELPSTLTSSSGALYGGFLHNVVQRVAQYICDTTVVDFVAHHELRIDHVYETFYTLIMGLLMYIRTHPDVPDETVKEIIASTLHIEGYTAKYPERKPQN